MIDEYLEDDIIIITPESSKQKILKKQAMNDTLVAIKFMTKQEFFRKYYFDYDERAYFYLMNKYHYHLDVCKLYLENLYVIEDKAYRSEKLNKLKRLKEELEHVGLLYYNPYFHTYLKTKKVLVYHYPLLEKQERKVLEEMNAIFLEEETSYPIPRTIKCAKSLEEEVVDVAISIRKLKKRGVPFSNIHLLNVTDEYFYTLTRIFSYFQIPLQPLSNTKLYGTKVVSDYLKTGIIEMENASKVTKKLVDVINSLSILEEGDIKNTILIDKLKKTVLPHNRLEEAVEISNMDESFEEDDYVFLLGMNQDVFPCLKQDDDFILDQEKEEVFLYTTDKKNQMIKCHAKTLLKKIPNLFLSYKLESPFQTFYQSSFIEELGLEIEDVKISDYRYSNLYNQLILAENLDDYYKYGVIGKNMNTLYNTYLSILYHSYRSQFTGIDRGMLKEFLSSSLHLSYTHLQNYYLCGFKYYVNHILHLDPYESNFSSMVGNMFHEALRYMDCEDFDLDHFMARFLEENEFSKKEVFFIKQLKEDLKRTLMMIHDQKEYTKFRDCYLEKTLQVDLSKESFSIILKGTVDKIMYYKNISDTYYAVIDYKSGSFDTNLKKIKFGLNMQLPIYLYLIEKSRIFPNSIFTGFYYQKIILPKKTFDKEDETLKLEGYSCDDVSVLELFDNSYQKSDIIRGLSIKKDGSFSQKSKLLNNEDVEKLLEVVENKVITARDKIVNGEFLIDPKYLEKENISCKYCKYKDLCFMREKDLVYLTLDEEL